MTAKLGMIYTNIAKYSDLLLSSKHQRLLTENPPKDPRIAAKQTHICEKTLNNFMLQP